MDGRQRCIFIKLTSMLHCEHIMLLRAGTSQVRTSRGESISVDIAISTILKRCRQDRSNFRANDFRANAGYGFESES
ncbi:hypothetical protein PR048_019771 [Dryococelus australis]|uniref:Uncharacterized protein n=1 Tax=Dryococelus australis TaxID=614101 RepID=A0ABQ9H4E2_9NEOP|nr:hypothetical protein PR048_019771 [Dryococelus australis]